MAAEVLRLRRPPRRPCSPNAARAARDTSAITARRARTVSPARVCTATARPLLTSIRSTCCPVRICAPAGGGAPGERGRQLAAAADRHREPTLLTDHGQQPADDAAAGGIRRRVGVHGVAGHQQPGGLGAEQFLPHASSQQQQEPGQPQRLRGADPAQQLGGPAHRRERGEQRAQQRIGDPFPLLAQRQPGRAIARTVLFEAGGGALPIAVQHRGRGAVRARWMRQHAGRVGPPQPRAA